METTINPEVYVIIGVIAVILTAIVVGLRFLLGSYTSHATQVLPWYGMSWLIYGGALYAGAWFNPRDMAGGSWTDRYLQIATGLGFFCCAIVPTRLPLPWLGRLGVFVFNLLLLATAFWLWYVATA